MRHHDLAQVRGRQSGGFTIIELLVVITIIGILAALLMPAVQSSRESAWRLHCTNNLKQFGLALANYETELGAYPFGVGGGGPPGHEPRWSAQSQLLPYLEQPALFHSLNFAGMPWLHDETYSAMNETAITTRVAGFLCPADFDGIDEPLGLAHINYRANAGTLPHNLSSDTGEPGSTGRNTGAFWFQSAVRPAHIRDGLSNTAMFSERCLGDSGSPDPRADFYLTGFSLSWCPDVVPGVTPRYTNDFEWSGGRWGDGNVFYTRYHHIFPPQANSCVLGGTQDHGSPVVVSASSRHPGGVNMLLADGSVRLVRPQIDPAVWSALGTIQGGEAVSADDF